MNVRLCFLGIPHHLCFLMPFQPCCFTFDRCLSSLCFIREELVHGLQNESPSFLKGLEENHLHYLVDLLVSEKKWVEEYSFQTFPFKLVMPARDSVPPNSQSPNGLSSLFTNGPSQSKPEKGKPR